MQPMTRDDIEPTAPSAYERSLLRSPTPPFPEIARGVRIVHGNRPGVVQRLRGAYVAARVSPVLSILQSTVARRVVTAIHEFWSSIILSHAISFTPLQLSSVEGMPGVVKLYDGRSANAVYYARTATGNTPLSNRNITPTPMCEKDSTPSLTTSVSRTETEQKINALLNGVLDLNTISLREWIELSYMSLFHKEELQLNINIVEGGNVVRLHTCVQAIVPPAEMDKLGTKQ